MSNLRTTILILSAALLSGCPSWHTAQTADTLGEGNVQVGIEPSFWILPEGAGTITMPYLSARFGISERFDFGGRSGPSGLELQTKYLITEPDADGVVLSVAPSFGGIVVPNAKVLTAQVPLLVGVNVGEHQLVLGPKAHLYHLGVSAEVCEEDGGGTASAGTTLYSLGSSLGFSAKLGKGFRILPEVAVLMPMGASASASLGDMGTSGSTSTSGAMLTSATLAILLGGDKK